MRTIEFGKTSLYEFTSYGIEYRNNGSTIDITLYFHRHLYWVAFKKKRNV